VHVTSLVTQKGGSGKSTLAASIAVAAGERGKRVFVLEIDRQGTLSDWIESRETTTGPDFERVDAAGLASFAVMNPVPHSTAARRRPRPSRRPWRPSSESIRVVARSTE
jgi:cellulose biosynthesis protein BcsQ